MWDKLKKIDCHQLTTKKVLLKWGRTRRTIRKTQGTLVLVNQEPTCLGIYLLRKPGVTFLGTPTLQ